MDRPAAARRCLLALGFIAILSGIGVGAALTASDSPLLPLFETCCLVPAGLVVVLELWPSVVILWRITASARHAIRRFRRQLDRLPEIPHPLDA